MPFCGTCLCKASLLSVVLRLPDVTRDCGDRAAFVRPPDDQRMSRAWAGPVQGTHTETDPGLLGPRLVGTRAQHTHAQVRSTVGRECCRGQYRRGKGQGAQWGQGGLFVGFRPLWYLGKEGWCEGLSPDGA